MQVVKCQRNDPNTVICPISRECHGIYEGTLNRLQACTVQMVRNPERRQARIKNATAYPCMYTLRIQSSVACCVQMGAQCRWLEAIHHYMSRTMELVLGHLMETVPHISDISIPSSFPHIVDTSFSTRDRFSPPDVGRPLRCRRNGVAEGRSLKSPAG